MDFEFIPLLWEWNTHYEYWALIYVQQYKQKLYEREDLTNQDKYASSYTSATRGNYRLVQRDTC